MIRINCQKSMIIIGIKSISISKTRKAYISKQNYSDFRWNYSNVDKSDTISIKVPEQTELNIISAFFAVLVKRGYFYTLATTLSVFNDL